MKENIYFYQDQDKFDEMSDCLGALVDDLRDFQDKLSDKAKEKILFELEKMSKLSKALNEIAEKNFDLLRNEIVLFLDGKESFEKIMTKCVKLQNELWEL